MKATRQTQEQYIKENKLFKKTLVYLKKKDGEENVDIIDGINNVTIKGKHTEFCFYTSKQNQNHIFRSRIFNKDNIEHRVIGHGTSRSISKKYFKDKDVWLDRDEKIICYQNTDVATTDNIIRQDSLTETLGYPFKRDIVYLMHLDGKDRLQYRRDCKELSYRNRKGQLKKGLDSAFVSRIYRLYLRFQGLTQNEIVNVFRTEETKSGYDILDYLKYIYNAMKSYHPFFYKMNGTSKYNSEWFYNTIRAIQMYGLLDRDYKLGRCHKSLNTDRNVIRPKDIEFWRLQHKAQEQMLSAQDIKDNHTMSFKEIKEQQATERKQAKKRMNEIIALHKGN